MRLGERVTRLEEHEEEAGLGLVVAFEDPTGLLTDTTSGQPVDPAALRPGTTLVRIGVREDGPQ